MHPSDELFHELVQCAQRGDSTAAGNLTEQFRDYLLLIANSEMNRDVQAKFGASDIVQETMLIAHQKFDQFRGSTATELKGWLRQIMLRDLVRVSRQFTKVASRSVRREVSMDAWQQPAPALTDVANTPCTDALIREEARLLAQAMTQLPEHYQLALRLREWEELSFPDIGLRMGISEEAAQKLCRRAMLKLQKGLNHLLGNSSQPLVD